MNESADRLHDLKPIPKNICIDILQNIFMTSFTKDGQRQYAYTEGIFTDDLMHQGLKTMLESEPELNTDTEKPYEYRIQLLKNLPEKNDERGRAVQPLVSMCLGANLDCRWVRNTFATTKEPVASMFFDAHQVDKLWTGLIHQITCLGIIRQEEYLEALQEGGMQEKPVHQQNPSMLSLVHSKKKRK